MKRLYALLTAVLVLSSCANRPGSIDDRTETETETAWEEPSEQFLDDLLDMYRYLNGPDSVFCYTEPLIKEENYVSPETLEFDRKAEKETRFISSHQRVICTLVSPGSGDETWQQSCPDVVYLTEADGRRTKLCPFEECRLSPDDECMHLEIDEKAVVCSDAVYFLWANQSRFSPDNPRRSEDYGEEVWMLLRYNLDDHTVEKVLDIENYAEILGAAFGLVYLQVRVPGTNHSYMLLVDTKNDRAAQAALTDLYEFSGHVYLEEDGVYILEYARGWRKCDPVLRFEESVSGLPQEYRSVLTDRGIGMKLVTNGEEEQVILDGYAPWVVTEDWIFATPYTGDRTLYIYTAKETKRLEPVVSRYGTKVVRFPRNANGSCDTGAETVVFEEGVSFLDADEAIYRMEPYGNSVRVVTVRPPDDDSDRPVWRRYLLTKDGAVIDGEGRMHGNSYDTGWW